MSQIILYQSEDGRTKLDVRLENQTVWLSQKQLTELFGKAKGTISEHIKHIFEDGELEPEATVRLFRTVQTEGAREVTREVECYNLDMVLALGFRVRSPMAVRFRQWAADKLKEYITKGFVLDDDRLKNPVVGNDYFEELSRRIQDIRTSERRFYQKITDIYATSVDYDKNTPKQNLQPSAKRKIARWNPTSTKPSNNSHHRPQNHEPPSRHRRLRQNPPFNHPTSKLLANLQGIPIAEFLGAPAAHRLSEK